MTPSIPLSLVGLLLLLSLVSSDTIDPSLEDLTNRNADFATRLYRAVSSRTDDNVFLSTFTLSTALAALLSATSGPTQDQLLLGLSLTGLDPETLPDLFQNLTTILQGNPALNLKQGVGIFPPQSFQVSSSYLDLLQTRFGGIAQSLAYTVPQEAIDTINRWAQDRTGDKDERFYVDKYHVVMVPMMFRADKYFLAYDRSVKVGVLKLPMTDGAAMLVLLPDEEVDVTAVEEEVTAEKIKAWIRQLKKTRLEVQLPRFLLEQSYSLRDILQTLDITKMFQDDAEIINMGGVPKLTQVYHKSVVSVDETSDDTTGGGVNVFSSLPPRLTVNRPFIFIIYHETTGSVLSMGRVIDPTKK
ncbi:Protein Z-dependent protease inhibitor [Collichthys lucidus]|uniref:Protein Z-dependent protease inhibitor n=1 Tax=Collichthys lucidus TaxID=240159 RepID=A0A4U5TUI8_COLLU|nr:Protein Z-dependent protease inhibitor [Collichthys lucidus]